jgi:hypothetical protein
MQRIQEMIQANNANDKGEKATLPPVITSKFASTPNYPILICRS